MRVMFRVVRSFFEAVVAEADMMVLSSSCPRTIKPEAIKDKPPGYGKNMECDNDSSIQTLLSPLEFHQL